MSIVTVNDIRETINMIQHENLDVRTITMGISLYDCVSDDIGRLCDNIYDKITAFFFWQQARSLMVTQHMRQ